MTEWARRIWSDLITLREKKPLIHNITNFVVMNSTANTILSIGASPVMAHSLEEVVEMVAHASALVLNIGTLEPAWIDAMIRAGKEANSRGIPVVFDPVGAGATRYRLEESNRILREVYVSIIRGNSAEIMALAGDKVNIRGVDSLQSAEEASDAARMLATQLQATLGITGVVDIVTDGKQLFKVSNGHSMMARVTGTGCAATVAVACFTAIHDNFLHATVEALGYFGLAGELAARISNGPGSFQVALFDALANITEQELVTGIKIES